MSGLEIFPGQTHRGLGRVWLRSVLPKIDSGRRTPSQLTPDWVVPMPVYVGRRWLASNRELGMPKEAKKQYELVEFMGRLSSINKAATTANSRSTTPITTGSSDPRKR